MGFYVPDGSPLLPQIEERAKANHDGKVSAYIRALVERDLSEKRKSVPGVALLELTERFNPAISSEMLSWLSAANAAKSGTLNQSRVVAGLLEALLSASPADAAGYRYGLMTPNAHRTMDHIDAMFSTGHVADPFAAEGAPDPFQAGAHAVREEGNAALARKKHPKPAAHK